MKKLYLVVGLALLLTIHVSGQKKKATPAPPVKSRDEFISELLGKMTIEEKIGQLNLVSIGFDVTGPIVSKNVEEKVQQGQVGGVFNTFTPVAVRKLQQMAVEKTRLKIPLLFGYDVVHGHRTILPIPLGLSATWDLKAIEQSARVAGDEASADGLNWVFSPMVDIARDPRWGRIAEGSGEDPFLGSRVAEAMVRGYQGNDLKANNTVMACVKHFALYGGASAGRDYNPVEMGERTMREVYLPPYKAAIDAGSASVMSSFNDIDGVPVGASRKMLTDLLRNELKFKGLLASDYTSLSELIPHGVAANEAEAAALALIAGNDMDMVSEVYINHLPALVKEGKVSEQAITDACRRVLEAKYDLGLFEDPYRYVNEKRAAATLMKAEYRSIARDIARRSFVLLKNTNNVLPLKKSGSIALVGPLANNKRDMIGNWSGAGDWKQAVGVADGLKTAFGTSVAINYAKGCNITNDAQMIARLNAHGGEIAAEARSEDELIREAVEVAKRSDVIVAVVGESQGMTGEAASRADIGLPGRQLDLLKALKATGKPLVIVLMNGRPMTLPWENENADAILVTWFAGTEAGNAIADVLTGAYNPSGKLTNTWPQHVGQVPLFYNHKATGRPFNGEQLDKYKSRYMDISNDPLFPFGFGLSFTTFSYGDVKLDKTKLTGDETVTVRCTVTNSGKTDGEEVVQLYVRDVTGSVTRPVKELKGFQKIMLKAGESREVVFEIKRNDLAFWNIDMKLVTEPGLFHVFVGGNSRDVKKAEFVVE